MTDLSHPELEAAILAAPDDAAPYLVYGDWLQRQGNPRGELIMLMYKADQSDGTWDGPLRDRILTRFRHTRDVLLGEELVRRMGKDWVRWEMPPGMPPCPVVHGFWQGPKSALTFFLRWRLGFIHSAALESQAIPPRRALVDLGIAGLLGQVLSHASGRFLRVLDVSLKNVDEAEYVSVIQALVENGRPRALETLSLSATYIQWQGQSLDAKAVSLEPLYPQLPRLRKLMLQGGRLELGALRLPELRELVVYPDVQGDILRRPVVRSIMNAVLPQLEALTVWLCRHPGGLVDHHVDDLQPLLDGTGMPGLRKLTLRGLGGSDAFCERLPGSALLPRLRELDLSRGTMTAAGAEALLAKPGAFQHLERLRLDGGLLDDALRERLKTLCRNVDV